MSQRYSEDIEAGTEIAREIGSTLWTLGSMAGLALLTVSIANGKFPITKIGNKLSNMIFDSKSTLKTAINNVYNSVQKNDKNKVREFQKSLVSGELKTFLSKPENKEIKNSIDLLLEEIKKIGEEGVNKTILSGENKDIAKVISGLFESHIK